MGVNIHTIKDIRFYLAGELEEIYQEPEISALANIITKTVIGISRLHQLYLPGQAVTGDQTGRIIEICNELKSGKPIQYILGETVFYDRIIRVSRDTLIPRPETEELVDLIIRENRGLPANIIDFGTGSGCIAIALASNLPGSAVTGIDISDEAITIAKENALLNSVNVSFIKGDIFSFDTELAGKADIIVSNPPYVRNSEKKFMKKNVLDYEPHIALFVTDSDPLVFYYAILRLSEKILAPAGKVYFEMNEAMGKPMEELLKSFKYSEIQIVTDINGKERIIRGKKDV
jgi:release factor glutamine methyltransferase